MRKDIDIELVQDVYSQITSFNIYYSSPDPHVAQQVTGELTNLFISENLELRQQKSEDTTKFLEQQLESARQTLAEQEEKVRVYKDQHLGELPSQLGSNVQILPDSSPNCRAKKMVSTRTGSKTPTYNRCWNSPVLC